MKLDRRTLLTGLLRRLPRSGQASAEEHALHGPGPLFEVQPPHRERELGSLASFPPGRQCCLEQGRYELLSYPEGIQVRDLASPHLSGGSTPVRPLRLSSDGKLWMDPDGTWPEDGILSPMTGSLTRLQEEEL